MIIFPAIDIQDGKAVRLRQGKKADVSVYGEDPLDIARRWQKEGAQWLHIVDLDGAFAGNRVNSLKIGEIARETGLPIQTGGGIRSIEDAAIYLENGVTRVIIGTLALEDRESFSHMAKKWPGRVGVSLDAQNGVLKSRGWVKNTEIKIADILPELEQAGSAFIIYTDIERDGMQSGINMISLANILRLTSLPIIVAGGISTLDDIRKLRDMPHNGNLAGVISGRALYEGSLNLGQAMQLCTRK